MAFCFAGVVLVGCRQDRKVMDAESDPPAQPEAEPPVSTEAATLPAYMAEGKQLYEQHCLVCHQATGGGVSGLNPTLKQTDYVLGDKERLVGILLNGSNTGLEVNGIRYANAMPGFSSLSNEELASLASYIRNSFGNAATPLTAGEVAVFRANR